MHHSHAATIGSLFASCMLLLSAACMPEGAGTQPGGVDTDPPPDTDTLPPTVSISSPSPGAQLSARGLVTIEGSAMDEGELTSVRVAVDGGPFEDAEGMMNWSFDIPIQSAADYSVSVQAEDDAGNVSEPVLLNFTVLPGWFRLGAIESGVTEVALAGDGDVLYRFYCLPGEGRLERWVGTAWTAVASLTEECNDPDLEVDGNRWVAGWATDDQALGFGTNAGGSVQTFTGTPQQWGMDVAVAQGRPYMAFASPNADGVPSDHMMLHVYSPVPSGPSAELNGGWGRDEEQDIGLDPAIAGDDDAWYTIVRQGADLYMKRGHHDGSAAVIEDVGPAVGASDTPEAPEIVLLEGTPVVSWIEDAATTVQTARFDGTAWELFGTNTVSSGSVGRIRTDTDGSDLYRMSINTSDRPLLDLSIWDGFQWEALTGGLDGTEAPDTTTGDVAVLGRGPVVAYVAGGSLKVKRLLR